MSNFGPMFGFAQGLMYKMYIAEQRVVGAFLDRCVWFEGIQKELI